MKFWDASAVIPLCIDGPRTGTVREIARKDGSLVVGWGSIVECHSAFARLRREGRLKLHEERQVREVLSILADSWTEIEPSDDIRNIAGRLLMNHPLRAADSLQLAAAVVWAERNPRGHPLVCLDLRMRDAAGKEGFTLLPENPR